MPNIDRKTRSAIPFRSVDNHAGRHPTNVASPTTCGGVLAKLRTARDELEDALNLTAKLAQYDPIVLPEEMREELFVMVDDLNWMLVQLEGNP